MVYADPSMRAVSAQWDAMAAAALLCSSRHRLCATVGPAITSPTGRQRDPRPGYPLGER